MRLKFTTNIAHTLDADSAWIWVERWDALLSERNKAEEGSGAGAFFHTCELWVRAETEKRLVGSTIPCAAMSVLFAFLVVLISLRNFKLAFMVILSILLIIVCLMAFMFGILQWRFGAIEAVGLIVFVGSSVDYSLHMAEAFSQVKQGSSFLRIKGALTHTGGAIVAAAITTTLAGVPILFCTIRVFARFGGAFITTTVLSLFCSLCIFSGALAMFGTGLRIPCVRRQPPKAIHDTIHVSPNGPVAWQGSRQMENVPACCLGVITDVPFVCPPNPPVGHPHELNAKRSSKSVGHMRNL